MNRIMPIAQIYWKISFVFWNGEKLKYFIKRKKERKVSRKGAKESKVGKGH
jgi:hypothetical protein